VKLGYVENNIKTIFYVIMRMWFSLICCNKCDVGLHNASYLNTEPFVPQITEGKVIKVYDGDTITIAARLPYRDAPISRFSVRLSGIDSPELKTHNPNEKIAAIMSRDKLHDLIFDKIVTLQNVSLEKYGRILADVYLDQLHVNQWLLDNHCAVEYDGGKKSDFHSRLSV